MFQARIRGLIPLLWTTACVYLCLGSWAAAQAADPIQQIRQMPPEFWNDDLVRQAKVRLHWQVEQFDAWRKRLLSLRVELEEKIQRAEQMRNQLQQDLGGAISRDATLRRELSTRVLGNYFDARVELAATTALIQNLEKELAAVAPDQAEEAIMDSERQFLEVELDGLRRQLARVGDRHAERSDIETKIRQIEVRLDAHVAQAAASKQRQAAERAAPLVDARGKLVQLTHRIEICEEELERLRAAERGAVHMRRLDRKIESLQTPLDRCTDQLNVVDLKREEVETLLELIEMKSRERSEEHPRDTDSRDTDSAEEKAE